MSNQPDDDDNVVINARKLFEEKKKTDLFGTYEAPEKKSKKDKILGSYCVHLTTILSSGAYSDCMYPNQIAKMADIKLFIITNPRHPRLTDLESLFDKVVVMAKTKWSQIDFGRWQKAIDDVVIELRYKNDMNALNCPTDRWSNTTSEGKLKPAILNAIVAIRFLLEQRQLTLRYDIWKSYDIIMNLNRKEEYVSVQTDSILREWRNWIYERKGTMYKMDVMKDAYHQIAKGNEFHSLQEKIKSIVWDGIDRYERGAKAFGLEVDDFTVRVFRHHLTASVARVFYPGVWYDLVLCIFGTQGAGKTTGLRILYGYDNIISCNFFELDPKKQSEATRNGIAAVENPDTFGDARKADFNKIKADVSTDSWVGRDAYGRVEDMRRVLITYVIWYTGNKREVLRDPTGNRRFIIVYSENPTDEDWLRLNASQLWAQAYHDMMALRASYLEDMRSKGIAEDYPKYLELPKDLWKESRKRQNASMVEGAIFEDWLPDIIYEEFVQWEEKIGDNGKIFRGTVYVLGRDVIDWLTQKYHNKLPVGVNQTSLTFAMENCVVVPKSDDIGLRQDITWTYAQILRSGHNLRGYRVDFKGEVMLNAFVRLKAIVHNHKHPNKTFDVNEIPNWR
jgi:hypothetical protein